MASKTQSEVKIHHGIVVSVSYATVDAFLIEYATGHKPKVLVHKNAHAPGLFSGFESSAIEREVLAMETLARVLHDFFPDVHTRIPKKIICILGEPWITSSIRSVTISKKQKVSITHDLLDRALESDFREMIADLPHEHKELEPLAVIDRKVLHITADGYTVQNPVGKKASVVEQQLYVSFAPQVVQDKVRDIISSVMPSVEVEFVSEQFVNWYAVSTETDEPFTLLRMGFDVTDIVVSDQTDGVRAVGHVPYGISEWYEMCTSLVGVAHPRHIRSLIHLYATERLNTKSEQHVEKTLRLLSKSANRAFDQLFGIVLEQSLVPRNVILCTDTLWEPFLSQIIRENHMLRDALGMPAVVMSPSTFSGANSVVWNDGKHHSYASLLVKAVGEIYFK